ncbi:8922_t:CDS:2 [Racocetra persica]|uniref:8922_t:CDS:1 n=1 Tax=Racocetra persica TaxID=160502 RepID=A0ACA9NBJ2_9GLOM|nr:8922_t:CDS:2 [Racocetra persica]
MADCYVEYIKLAIAINQIPQENILKNNTIFNCRYKEFDDAYLLGYFLHPGYHGLGLKTGIFRRICEIAANYWKALGNDEYSCTNLLADLRKYKWNEDPFDMGYKKENLTQQELKDSVNGAIISDIDELLFYSNEEILPLNNQEHLLSNNQDYSLSNNQEHSLSNDQ